jgi:hypothetical protein
MRETILKHLKMLRLALSKLFFYSDSIPHGEEATKEKELHFFTLINFQKPSKPIKKDLNMNLRINNFRGI